MKGVRQKTGHTSETVRDLLLITNKKSHRTTPFQIRWKSSALDDLEGQYCNRNCIGCSASSLGDSWVFSSFSVPLSLLVPSLIQPGYSQKSGILVAVASTSRSHSVVVDRLKTSEHHCHRRGVLSFTHTHTLSISSGRPIYYAWAWLLAAGAARTWGLTHWKVPCKPTELLLTCWQTAP